MKPAKSRKFVAWIFDFYFLSFLAGSVVALTLALLKRPGTLALALSMVGTVVLVSVVYHVFVAQRVPRLSPGEGVAGRFVKNGAKNWHTPYARSRWPIFGLSLAALVMCGNAWDGIGEGKLYTIRGVLLSAVLLLALSACVLAAAKGRPAGLLGVALYFCFLALTAWFGTPTLLHEMRLAMFFGFLALGISCLVVNRVYSKQVVAHDPAAA